MKLNGSKKIIALLLAAMMTAGTLTALSACEAETPIAEQDDEQNADGEEGGKKDSLTGKAKLPSEMYASLLTAKQLTITSSVKSGGYTTDWTLRWDGKLLYVKNETTLYVPGENEDQEYYIDVATGTKYVCKKDIWSKEAGEVQSFETLLKNIIGYENMVRYIDLQYSEYDADSGRYSMNEQMQASYVGGEEWLDEANLVAYCQETAEGFCRVIKANSYGDVAELDSCYVAQFTCEQMTLPTV